MPEPAAWLPYLQSAYDNRYFTNFGPNEQLLSRRLAERFGGPGAEVVLTSNATVALTAALLALGVRGNVAIPAFTFPATMQAVIAAGCRPVLLDVDPVTWEITPEILADAMTRCTIDAVMPVRVFGLVRDHSGLISLALRHGIPVITDAAAALGHVRFELPPDEERYVEVFSLHATKSFAIGEGGAILCSPAVAAKVRRVINFGLNEDRSFGDGINAKMSEFQAAVGLAALDMLDGLLMRRRAMAEHYVSSLGAVNSLSLPVQTEGCPWSVFPVLLPAGSDVPKLVVRALSAGLQLRRYYHPSLATGYRGDPRAVTMASPVLPVSERLSEGMICLPVYADATDAELVYLSGLISDLFMAA